MTHPDGMATLRVAAKVPYSFIRTGVTVFDITDTSLPDRGFGRFSMSPTNISTGAGGLALLPGL
jgi:hypothetical protein